MPFPVDAKYAARTEQKLGTKLPLSYVARLLQENGGSVEVGQDVFQLCPILDDSDGKRLSRTCNDVVRETRMAHEWQSFPRDAVAIGVNAGGDVMVFLQPDGADRLGDDVRWWDHETGETHFVANDFLELAFDD